MKLIQTLVAATLITLSAQALAADNLATVNGKAIKTSTLDYIIKDAKDHGQQVDDNAKQMITKKLIDSEIVYQAAQKAGMDKKADFKTKMALMERELLTQAYLQDFMKKNPVSDADVKKEYENYKKAYGAKEYSARHILVKTEDEAKAIISQLKKGGDFAKLAKEKSMDPGSKSKGGDLGWFSPATMVKPFSEAVQKLKKGELTQEPVQTNFGWHVIKLVDSRKAKAMPFESAKPGLTKKLQQAKLEKMLSNLRNKAKVVVSK